MTEVTLWHNPRCSKSRGALTLLRDRDDVRVTERRYLDEPPTREELQALLGKLGLDQVRPMVRRQERRYRELGLADAGDEELLDAVVAEPRLLERPIAVVGERAVIGRPPEQVLDLL